MTHHLSLLATAHANATRRGFWGGMHERHRLEVSISVHTHANASAALMSSRVSLDYQL